MDRLDKSRKTRSKGLQDGVLSPIEPSCVGRPSLNDSLGVTEPKVATVLPSEVEKAEKLDFDEPNVIELLKKRSYKVYMCVEITSNIFRPLVIVLDTDPGPNLIRTSFTSLKFATISPHTQYIPAISISQSCPGHRENYADRSASQPSLSRPFCCCGQSCRADYGSNIVYGQIWQGNLPMERSIIPIRSRMVVIISEDTLLWDTLNVL